MRATGINIPLLRAGDIVNAAADALQRHRLAADGRADVVNVPDGAQVQAAACVHQARVQVTDAVTGIK